jgi:hypothetical protein
MVWLGPSLERRRLRFSFQFNDVKDLRSVTRAPSQDSLILKGTYLKADAFAVEVPWSAGPTGASDQQCFSAPPASRSAFQFEMETHPRRCLSARRSKPSAPCPPARSRCVRRPGSQVKRFDEGNISKAVSPHLVRCEFLAGSRLSAFQGPENNLPGAPSPGRPARIPGPLRP